MPSIPLNQTNAWKALESHASELRGQHLRDLLGDPARGAQMRRQIPGIVFDFARQWAVPETLERLLAFARQVDLEAKIQRMRRGEAINVTENRAVLHYALRAPQDRGADPRPKVDGQDAIAAVHHTLGNIEAFARDVRSGATRGVTGKRLTDVVVIGIGGSYLGTEFVYEALRTDPPCATLAGKRRLRFLANVDPIDVARALDGLCPDRTLVVIVSKTFTTAETILNARTVRDWLVERLNRCDVSSHLAAVSAATKKAVAFGVPEERVFPMWDWVGGRYSVCSAVGVLPLAVQFGMGPVREFLQGARAIDQHFFTAPLNDNLPVLMGLWGLWNSSFLGYGARAMLPYCQALHRFAAHLQQLSMESNGKRVTLTGQELGFDAGEIDFGEPGTNGQHSFYQLLHQGRVVPADFVGFRRSQRPASVAGQPVANHDELMANFFAQPDALAIGKTLAEAEQACQDEEKPVELAPHRVFPGNRPSNVLLLDQLTPTSVGQLLALYEHRTAVQGFLWGINSFDQWGVELGKVTAEKVREQLAACRAHPNREISGFNPSTAALLKDYL